MESKFGLLFLKTVLQGLFHMRYGVLAITALAMELSVLTFNELAIQSPETKKFKKL